MPSSSDQSRNPFTESMALVDGERGGSFTLTTIFYNHQTRETATVMYLRVWVGKYWWPGVTLTHTFNLPLLTDSNNPLSTLPSSICGVEKCGTADGRGPCAAHLRPNQLDGQNARLRAPTHETAGLSCVREKTGKRQKISNVQVGRNFERKRRRKSQWSVPTKHNFQSSRQKTIHKGVQSVGSFFPPSPSFDRVPADPPWKGLMHRATWKKRSRK